ncbi:hypothetical protein Q8W71_28925 [Methylobacterium sp. NEAU 140]|uniref:hypothetical protein n=1 Tax=Methylobacterium sp. NEAU 140 TaxID=3064945 RepID=UPI0027358C21|nr:hypothetical protein [Methylobacterium sp. NEAU 140]MDP4026636.1 hypothetical protein [Methylobacterium sp. NEAU 140]
MTEFAPIQICLVASLLATAPDAHAQSIVDGTGTAVDAESTRIVLALIGQHLRSTDAKVTDLRTGRGGAICGAVEVRNRMGTYTGARPFVADLAGGFFGRLPEGPELRNPASIADYRAMERAQELFTRNCSER